MLKDALKVIDEKETVLLAKRKNAAKIMYI